MKGKDIIKQYEDLNKEVLHLHQVLLQRLKYQEYRKAETTLKKILLKQEELEALKENNFNK